MNSLDFMDEKEADAARPQRIKLDRNNMRKGFAQLVLTVIELLRQLLEKQALRRMEGGSLSEEEMEILGLAFLQLSEQMDWFRNEFGLAEEELNLDLGPLGKLL